MNAAKVPLRYALAGAGALVGIWLLRKALLPFFVAMVLAYLLGPLVTLLARRLGRPFAVVVVLTGFVASVATLLALLLPWLAAQGGRMIGSLPRWRTALEAKTGPWLAAHPELAERLRKAIADIDPLWLLQGLRSTGGGLLGGLLSLMALLLVPLILYFLLLEGPAFLEQAGTLVPPRHRPRVGRMAAAIHERLGGYIRGQIAVVATMVVLHGIVLSLVGVPWAWLLALGAGLALFIPYTPYAVALPLTLLLTWLEFGSGPKVGMVLLAFLATQAVEGFYLTPVWVGRASKLHPLEVLLALLAFGAVFGLPGLILAVPLMVVVKVVLEELVKDYRAHPWFEGRA
jgi:predicted PurR-regulated permease PerM